MKQKLPIGVDSFEKLRRENFYYVDKSLLIRDLLNGWSEVNLFTRPRRFGKTLNMSMLKSFFEIGGDPALFAGLAIADEKELCAAYMGKHPVVFVSLKGVDGPTFAEARGRLSGIISREARRLDFLLSGPMLLSVDKELLEDIICERWEKADLSNSLLDLSRLLQKHYGQKAILLIDEYDVPLDKAYQNGYYGEMIDLIRALFGAALKTNDSLYFAVLTGCLRVARESVFTGLNNPKVHSIADAQFDEFFGFTNGEVARMLADYGLQSHGAQVREWYDGYRFGKQDVYCPWDVVNYCYDLLADDEAEPQAYWRNVSGNDIVRRLIDRADTGTVQGEIERLLAGECIRKALNERLTHNEIDQNLENLWSLLFMTGYLTTTERPRQGIYTLVIPNLEVRQIYIEQVLLWFREKTRAETGKLADLYRAFEQGATQKIKEILDALLLDTISFHDAHESFYHGFLLALLSTCADWYATSNAETGKGRSDILVERKDRKRGFVIEVKDVKDERLLAGACREALRQIEEKDYTASLRRYRIPEIWIYGIAFWDKECAVLAKRL